MSFTRFAVAIMTAVSICTLATPVNAAEVASVLKPAIEKLKDSKTRVMLPTWLPANCKGPLGTGTGMFEDGYEVWLGDSGATTTFFTSGGKGKATKSKRPIRLANGKIAYLQTLKDICLDWTDKDRVYRVGYPSWGKKKDIEILTRIANSMKFVETKN